ncbi:MAG: hypothetical protein SFX73_37990 [Kofleriaceae bacterium]|nr:hypothetical protein [Kofleriaceae bacterium]
MATASFHRFGRQYVIADPWRDGSRLVASGFALVPHHAAGWELGALPFDEAVRELRSVLREHAVASWWTDAQVLDEVRRELSSMTGRLRLYVREQRMTAAAARHDAPHPVEPATDLAWIELEVVDELGNALANERFELRAPSGATRSGALDGNGAVRLDALEERGSYEVSFPDAGARYTFARG